MVPEGGTHLPCASARARLDFRADAARTDKGIAKIAKQLGVNFAEAIVRASGQQGIFSSSLRLHTDWLRVPQTTRYPRRERHRGPRRRRRSRARRACSRAPQSTTTLTVKQAFWASEHHAAEKEVAKKEERVLKRWKHLIRGLRLRERLQADYKPGAASSSTANGRSEVRGTARSCRARAVNSTHSSPT
jgi:hypothetical protein